MKDWPTVWWRSLIGDLLQVVDCDYYNAIKCLCLGWLCRQLQKPDIQTPAVVQVGGGGMPAC